MHRKKGRRKIWMMLPVLVVLVLLGVFLFSYVFVVRNVNVQGNTATLSSESVIRSAQIGFGKSIFSVNKEEIRRSVNACGVLELENIDIRYPDTVNIVVKPRNRVAMTVHMGRIRVLDEEAYVVENLSEVPAMDLIYVSGLQIQGCDLGETLRAQEDQIEAYRAAIQAIRSHGAGVYVSELILGNPENMSIITRTGITVQLGDARNLPDKIAWMKSAVADLESRGETGGTLDVRSGTKADYRVPATPQPSYAP